MFNDPTLSKPPMNLWDRLTMPHPSLQKLEEKRQAQLLARLALVVIPLGFLGSSLIILIPLLSSQRLHHLPIIEFIGAVLGVLVYGLSRTRHYKIGAQLAIGLSTICILGVTFLSEEI